MKEVVGHMPALENCVIMCVCGHVCVCVCVCVCVLCACVHMCEYVCNVLPNVSVAHMQYTQKNIAILYNIEN